MKRKFKKNSGETGKWDTEGEMACQKGKCGIVCGVNTPKQIDLFPAGSGTPKKRRQIKTGREPLVPCRRAVQSYLIALAVNGLFGFEVEGIVGVGHQALLVGLHRGRKRLEVRLGEAAIPQGAQG